MNDQMPPLAEEPKKNKTAMYIAIGVAVLCCCCVSAYVFYQYLGDPIAKALGF